MEYVNASDPSSPVFPYALNRLRRDNPNTSFPKYPSDALLAGYDVYPVSTADAPPYDRNTERLVQAEPALVDGKWVREWTVVPLTVDELAQRRAAAINAVKQEASRRILQLAPEWKQRNATARGLEFARKMIRNGPNALTSEEEAEEVAIIALWTEVKRLRTVSDQLEAMDPLPQDFADDSYWTAAP